MSKYTTYFKSSDGHLFGSVGDNTGKAFPTAKIFGSNSSAYPDAVYGFADGGSPILGQNLALNNGNTAFTSATLWTKLPPQSFLQNVTVTVTGGTLTGGTFSMFWEDLSKVSGNALSITPAGGTAATTPALPTSSTPTVYQVQSVNGLSPVLRIDVAGLAPATYNGTIYFFIQYVDIPTDDV